MHDRVVVIGSAKVVGVDFPEVMLLSRNNVLQEDADMIVPVGPGLFMVKAQSM